MAANPSIRRLIIVTVIFSSFFARFSLFSTTFDVVLLVVVIFSIEEFLLDAFLSTAVVNSDKNSITHQDIICNVTLSLKYPLKCNEWQKKQKKKQARVETQFILPI